MTEANAEKRQRQKLPLNLRVMSALTAIGMVMVSALGEYVGRSFGARWSDLYHNLWRITPSLSHLEMSNLSNVRQFETISQAVTVLYGMLVWSGSCIAISALWSIIAAPTIVFDDKPGLEKWRMVVLVISLVAVGAAITFFGLLPLRSDGFLIRGGVLDASPLWWMRAFALLSASAIGIMAVVYALVVLTKMQRRKKAS